MAVFCRALPAEDEAKAEKAQRSKFESEGAIKFWAPQEYRAARLPIKSENKTLYFFNKLNICGGGGIGRRAGLRLLWILLPCGFKSHSPHQIKNSYHRWLFFILYRT